MVAEHEDQTDCFGNPDSVDPHHSPVYMPRFQLWKVSIFLKETFVMLNFNHYFCDYCIRDKKIHSLCM